MEGLDFSALSDDQLLGLVRASLREVSRRDPALADATRAAMLDEAERAKIARAAGDREAARLRALERERVAREAAEQVRAAHASQYREASREREVKAAEEARVAVVRSQEASKGWLRRAGALVGREPGEITLLLLNTGYGRRVLIDEGADSYSKYHLSDWTHGSSRVSTTRELMKRKPDLAAFSAEFEARHGGKTLKLVGANYDWVGEPA